VIIMTPDGRIDWVNAGFTHLNELTCDQVKGQGIAEFLRRVQTDAAAVQWMETCIRDRRGGRNEVQRQVLSGKRLWLDVEIQPIVNEFGVPTSIVATETDVTERREHQDLQVSLVSQLEKANKELNDFAYIVSHDLKAPLRGIKNLATWIAEDCKSMLPPDNLQQMNLLTGRVDRMQKLIEGILQYSRAGRAEDQFVHIDLNELLGEVVDLLAPPDHIEVALPGNLPTIVGDRTRIQQVFQNLLSNAIKYMDKPEGRIAVSSSETEDFWRFSVTDNGPGIEEKYFDLIFGMFKTLNTRDDVDSTGVGLTVVKKIVEHYGGRAWVESKVGEGSTFFFTLAKRELDRAVAKSQQESPAQANLAVVAAASGL
jgi:two-component system sensor kinase FixL